MFARLNNFRANEGGTVTVIGAFMLPAAVALTALVAEGGQALLTRSENQRIADIVAYAGALALTQTGSEAAMRAAAENVAAMNGRTADQITLTVCDSERKGGGKAVTATVMNVHNVMIGAAIGETASWRLSGVATVELAASKSSCILALNEKGLGLTLSDGAVIDAPNCVVASNAAVSVPCGATIRTTDLRYGSASPPNAPCNGIVAPAGGTLSVARQTTIDPFAGDADVALASGRVAIVSSFSAPSAPLLSTKGSNLELGWNALGTLISLGNAGCSGFMLLNVWTVDCPSGGTYSFGAVRVAGGISVVFKSNPGVTYNFSQTFVHDGWDLSFGEGTYNFASGLRINSGASASFGRGAFNFGSTSTNCYDSLVSLCHLGDRLSFAGPSRFTLSAGVYATGGSTLDMGGGSTNSYWIGPSSKGDSLIVGGGASVRLADAMASGSDVLARFVGNIRTGGNSCLQLPSARNLDVRGSLDLSGGVRIGAGAMTVTGFVGIGANSGGNASCWGASLGVNAQNVTWAIGASATISSGGCAGRSFCVGSGYSSVVMTAPSSGSRLLVVGPQNGSTAGGAFIGGASNQRLSGAFYFPTGPINLAGGASFLSGPSDCLQIVGSQIALSGGSSAASSCIAEASSAGAVSFVQ